MMKALKSKTAIQIYIILLTLLGFVILTNELYGLKAQRNALVNTTRYQELAQAEFWITILAFAVTIIQAAFWIAFAIAAAGYGLWAYTKIDFMKELLKGDDNRWNAPERKVAVDMTGKMIIASSLLLGLVIVGTYIVNFG